MTSILSEKLKIDPAFELREFYCEDCDYVFWEVPNSPIAYCPKCEKTLWPNEDIKIKKVK